MDSTLSLFLLKGGKKMNSNKCCGSNQGNNFSIEWDNKRKEIINQKNGIIKIDSLDNNDELTFKIWLLKKYRDVCREEGRKQGALEAYNNIIKCLKGDNLKFKRKENSFVNNSELEQYSREVINEIKGIIEELEEGEVKKQ